MQELRKWTQLFDVPNVVKEMVFARVLFALSDIEPVLDIRVDPNSRIERDYTGSYLFRVWVTVEYFDAKEKTEKQITQYVSGVVFDDYFCYKVPFNDTFSIVIYIPPVFIHELNTIIGLVQNKLLANPDIPTEQLHLEYGYAWKKVRK